MTIVHAAVLYSVIREEHLVHSGFFLHEYFSLFAPAPVDCLHIQAVCGGQELGRVGSSGSPRF